MSIKRSVREYATYNRMNRNKLTAEGRKKVADYKRQNRKRGKVTVSGQNTTRRAVEGSRYPLP